METSVNSSVHDASVNTAPDLRASGIRHNAIDLSERLSNPEVSARLCYQYTYFLARAMETWTRLLEFDGFSGHFDEATLALTRLGNLLRSSDPDAFPVMEEVLPATEAACCRIYHLASSNKAVAVDLLEELENRMFQRDRLRNVLNARQDRHGPAEAVVGKYLRVSDAFFNGVRGMHPFDSGLAAMRKREAAGIHELGDIFACELLGPLT